MGDWHSFRMPEGEGEARGEEPAGKRADPHGPRVCVGEPQIF